MSVPATKYPDAPRAALFYSGLLERRAPAAGRRRRRRRDPGAAQRRAITTARFVIEGRRRAARSEESSVAGYRVATPGYLEAAGLRLRAGAHARATAIARARSPVAVVNQSFVRQFLPRTEPIGVRFKFLGMDAVNPVFTIVGVVGDVHHRSLVEAADPEVFISAYQQPFRARYTMYVVVRPSARSQQGTLGDGRARRGRGARHRRAGRAVVARCVHQRVGRRPPLHADGARHLRRASRCCWRRPASTACSRSRWRSARRRSASAWRSAPTRAA